MTSVPAIEAGSKIGELLNETAASHEPIRITSEHGNGVLVCEEDWHSVQETLYLLAIPKMRKSIQKGLAEPLSETFKNPGW